MSFVKLTSQSSKIVFFGQILLKFEIKILDGRRKFSE